MEGTGSLEHRIVKAFEAILLERRARLQEFVRARVTEHRTGERRRSPEDATNAVESLSEDLEVAVLDRESREAAQIDAALERLARGEYGICGNCGTVIGARAAQGAALRPALYRVSGGRGDARAAGLRGWTTRSLRRMRISRSTTARMTPWWCALFHRRLWEKEQVFEKPDYPFMQSTSSWCPKCEERRT